MQKNLKEIADHIDAELNGDPTFVINGLSGLEEAREDELSFVVHSKYLPSARKSRAAAFVLPLNLEVPGRNMIRVQNPSLAFARIAQLWQRTFAPKLGVHPSAVIGNDVVLGSDVSVGPYVVIEDGVQIGDRSVISAGCFLAYRSKVGEDCVLHSHVSIREFCEISNRVTLHCGVVVGSDGFGYEQVNGKHVKIPQIGIVVIEDDVEVGANSTIDRARLDKTRIGRGTKIDNLVQIAHNVQVGEDCILVAQAGVAGSCTIGKGAIIAGQAGIVGHLKIGEGAIVSSTSGVTRNVPPYTHVAGFPAQENKKFNRVQAHVRQLPRYVKMLKEMKQRLDKICNSKEIDVSTSKNDR